MLWCRVSKSLAGTASDLDNERRSTNGMTSHQGDDSAKEALAYRENEPG
jgi:hypothetical protein